MSFDYTPPKYAQVVAEIQRRIETGDYPPGTLLPSEHQLVTEFGVSRPTIVRALTALRQDGWIETQQGRGSFVRGRPALAGAQRTRPAENALELPETALSGELVQAGVKLAPAYPKGTEATQLASSTGWSSAWEFAWSPSEPAAWPAPSLTLPVSYGIAALFLGLTLVGGPALSETIIASTA